jgi:hypothetical protein
MSIVYKPNNPQAAQRYGVVPYQRVDIILDDVDRTQGQTFPQFEGSGFYVLSTDFPFLISVVDRATNKESTLLAVPGLEFSGEVKSFTITHPLLSNASFTNRASFLLLKGEARYTNSLHSPYPSFAAPYSLNTNTAGNQVTDVYLPPNARLIAELKYALAATTVTQASFSFIEVLPNGGLGLPITGPSVAGFPQLGTYGGRLAPVLDAATGLAFLRESNIVIPSHGPSVLRIGVVGTVLSSPSEVRVLLQ